MATSHYSSATPLPPLNLAIGQPQDKTLPTQALQEAYAAVFSGALDTKSDVERPFINRLLNYGVEEGEAEFRQCLASYLACAYHRCPNAESQHGEQCSSKHPTITADQLVLTTGVSHSLDIALGALTQPGDYVIVEEPSYFLSYPIIQQRHLKIISLPVNCRDGGYDMQLLRALIEQYKPRAMYCIPQHQNPTGTSIPLQQRQELIDLAEQHQMYLLSDDVYQLLNRYTLDDQSSSYAPPLIHHTPNTQSDYIVSLGSVSKTLSPGIRFGWCQSTVNTIQKIQQNGVLLSGSSMSQLSGSVVTYSIQHQTLQQNIKRLTALYQQRCAVLSEAIDQYLVPHGFTYTHPFGGYFLYLQMPIADEATLQQEMTADQLLDYCKHPHINVTMRSGNNCCLADSVRSTKVPAASGSANGTIPHHRKQPFPLPSICIRLCFARLEDAELKEAIRRVGSAYNEMTQRHNN